MALGTTLSFRDSVDAEHIVQLSRPASVNARWKTAIDAGGPATADNAGADITNPTTQITAATRHIIASSDVGTILRVRLGYDAGLTGITNPVVQLFGRTDVQAWQRITNQNRDVDITLTTATSDVSDGTLKYSKADLLLHSADLDGCDEILVGVKTALAGTGSTANSIIELKLIN